MSEEVATAEAPEAPEQASTEPAAEATSSEPSTNWRAGGHLARAKASRT